MAKVELTTVQAVREIKNLRDEVKLLAKELGASGDEINFISKAMTGAATAFQKSANKVSSLQAKLDKLTLAHQKLKDQVSAEAQAEKKALAIKKAAAAQLRETTAALTRQQKAIGSTGEQFRNLFQTMKLAGASKAQLDSLVVSFRVLRTVLGQGTLSVNQFNIAMQRWRRTTAAAQRGLRGLEVKTKTEAMKRFGFATAFSKDRLSDFASTAVLTFGPLSGVGSRIIALLSIVKRGNKGLIGGTVAFALFSAAAIKVGVASVKAGLEIQKIRNVLSSVTDTAFAAAEQFNFIARAALDMGLDVAKAGKDFASMLAAARGGSNSIAEIQRLFTAGATAAKVLGLSTAETGRMFKAFEQIMSKGVVQSEEVKQQLGDVLPGALQKTADAFGVTTSAMLKMMEQGGALSEVFVREFAEVLEREFAKSLPDAVNRLDTQFQKFKTGLTLVGAEFDDFIGLSRNLALAFTGLNRAMDAVFGIRPEEIPFSEQMDAASAKIEEIQAKIAALGEGGGILGKAVRNRQLDLLLKQLEQLQKLQKDILASQKEAAGVSEVGVAGMGELKNLRELPIEAVDKFRDRVTSLNAQIAVLRDTSIDFDERVKIADNMKNRTAATEKAITIMKKLEDEEIKALAIQENVVFTADAVREAIIKLITEEKNLADTRSELAKASKKSETALAKELASFDKALDKAKAANEILGLRITNQSELADLMEIEAEFAEKFPLLGEKQLKVWMEINKVNKLLTAEWKTQEKILDQRVELGKKLKELEQENAVLQQKIAGNDDMARQMEARFELMKKFPDLTQKELEELTKVLNANKKLKEVLKEQEALEKVRAELAQDFAESIGEAFEDAVIAGEKLSDVLQALLDDIQKIILRVLVTKPLENFLTDIFTGAANPGSTSGPGGTPFFGGLLGKLFAGGEAGGVGGPGQGPGPAVRGGSAAEKLAKMGKSFEKVTESSEGISEKNRTLGDIISDLLGEKTAERTTTIAATGSLTEFQIAVRSATVALQTMATTATVGASGSSGDSLSSILNFASSFTSTSAGGPGERFGGGAPGFVPGFGFTGPRQSGGPVGPNNSFLVGEDGPEVFRPGRSGVVQPMQGGGQQIFLNQTMNVTTPDEPGFRRSGKSNMRMMGKAARASIRGLN